MHRTALHAGAVDQDGEETGSAAALEPREAPGEEAVQLLAVEGGQGDSARTEAPAYFVACGFLLAGYILYSLRILAVPWLWNGIGLSYYIPIVSPSYKQAEHWQTTTGRSAILIHVTAGIGMLVAGCAHCDKQFCQQYPSLHRWLGYVYVLCGLLTFGALQCLSNTMTNSLLTCVNVACLLWVGGVAFAIAAAKMGRGTLYCNSIGFSLTIAATPIVQQFISWGFGAPTAMALRAVLCVSNLSAWDKDSLLQAREMRWGTTNDTLWGEGCTWEERPEVFSADGYGEGQQVAFAVSMWLGLWTTTVLGLLPGAMWSAREQLPSIRDFVPENFTFEDARLLDIWRRLLTGVMATWNQIEDGLVERVGPSSTNGSLKTRAVWCLFKPVMFVLLTIYAVVAAFCICVGIVMATYLVTEVVTNIILILVIVIAVIWFVALHFFTFLRARMS